MDIKKKDIEKEYQEFFLAWLPKVVERGTFLMLNVKDHVNIKENDMEVLKFFYKNYYNGELSQFASEVQSSQEQTSQSVTQTNLFSADVTVCPDTIEFGIGVEDMIAETKKEKK